VLRRAGLRISEAVAPTERDLDLPEGSRSTFRACRQSSGVLSAGSEFSLQGSTRWADITRVTSVQPARSATLSSCATLTYRTTRGRLTIPRRHRTRNWAARASRDSQPLRSRVRRFSSPCLFRRAAVPGDSDSYVPIPFPWRAGQRDRHPLEPPVRCTYLEVAAIVALGLGWALRLRLTRTAGCFWVRPAAFASGPSAHLPCRPAPWRAATMCEQVEKLAFAGAVTFP
jgi:hypothetical protein